jgi:hypothetical protein
VPADIFAPVSEPTEVPHLLLLAAPSTQAKRKSKVHEKKFVFLFYSRAI